MAKAEFGAVQDRNWTPVELVGEAVPTFLSNMPRHKAFRFLASGESNIEAEGALVGGIDVYRHAPDDPVALNKDWYAVRAAADGILHVHGPIRDSEHWLNEVPERYNGVEVLGGAEPRPVPHIAAAGSIIKSQE